MCINILPSRSFVGLQSSYSVMKVLIQYVKVRNVQTSFRHMSKSSTKSEIITDITQNVTRKRVKSDKNEPTDTEKTSRKIKSTVRGPPADMLEYFNSKESLKSILKYLPKSILKRARTTLEAQYTVDRDVAKKLAATIVPDILRGEVPVFESNPGLGLVSRELLEAGVRKLKLCEPLSAFTPHMENLKKKYPDQVEIINKDFFTLGKMNFQDNLDGGSRVETLFSGIQTAKWEDDPVIKFVGVLPSLRFVRHLIRSQAFQTSVIAYGRSEFYFVMSPPDYFYLTCGHEDGYFHYRSITVLFQLMFEWNLLEKLPRKAFLPWEARYSVSKWSKLIKVRSIDPDLMYVVKIVPRRDFFQEVASLDQLQPLWYFVRYHLRSRKNRVIPELENWIPGCGPRLITNGMTIYTEFGDLTPREILSVFHKFVRWPEYPVSPFISAMEATFLRTEPDGDVAGKDSDDEETVVEDDDEDNVES